MKKIVGKYNTAKVFATTVDDSCMNQIKDLCDLEWLAGCNIAIMPDTHAGAASPIGTTIQLHGKVAPSMVGVDAGCGMLVIEIPKKLKLNLQKIDMFIQDNIPSGLNVYDEKLDVYSGFLGCLHCYGYIKNWEHIRKSIGTLGSGNHFLEINEAENGKHYLVIHSGSRNLGHQVATHYQEIAYEHCNKNKQRKEEERVALIKRLKEEGREKEISQALKEYYQNFKEVENIPYPYCYIEGDTYEDYLHDIEICNEFASLNRKMIAQRILDFILKDNGIQVDNIWIDEYQPHLFEFGYETKNKEYQSYGFETIHNYIDKHEVLRKGAICAQRNKRVIIPINMRDGSIIALGKSNVEYNKSAPHGAGRLYSRTEAMKQISLEEFQLSMKDVYSTSVNSSTLDESPMVYKNMEEILSNIQDTVTVKEIIKPIYNFKASEKRKR